VDLTTSRATLAQTITLQGLGLHSGAPVECHIHPFDRGIEFLWEGMRIPADCGEVTGVFQRTQLGPIHTVEHLMAAFAFAGVTDALVDLTAPEVPAMDGSSLPFVIALNEAGSSALPPRLDHRLFARVYHHEGDVKVAISAGEGHFRYTFDTGERWPGVQIAECWLSDREACQREIAPARTLVFEEDLEKALAAGLGRGLDRDSCLVLGAEGYVNDARFPEEPARHKLLDLIGDLSLAGYPLTGINVVAERSGHRTHLEAAKKLKDLVAPKEAC
jgi:UDP-3-O-[3-hydroxymyristoyl] N-acetylglucosamine deacetylase